jgi:RNA polymerase sigma-70 factor (ECF subfamily)
MPVAASTSDTERLGSETLWREFSGRLGAFVSRRVSSGADVDDIVQWVFLQLHRSLGEIRNGERIHAWLYSTARRAIGDYYRSRTRRREVPSGDALDLDRLHASRWPAPDAPGERAEVAACLAPLVERLAPVDREAIVLTEIRGLRLADAAVRAGVSLSGMKSRSQRARRRLRQAMLDCCHVALDVRGTPISCTTRAVAAGPCCDKRARTRDLEARREESTR